MGAQWQKPKYDGLARILKALEGLKEAARRIEEKKEKLDNRQAKC